MRSLVVIETDPVGAPVRVFRPTSASAPPFQAGGDNPLWTEVVTTASPTSLSLSVGLYHIVIDKFRNFNASDTQLRVSAGHVHQFKANLSQGDFMGFLRVSSNVKGAHVWLDDPKKERPEWGTTPNGELVSAGSHSILIDVPGFQPVRTEVTLESGERKEIEVELKRVDYGSVRVSADANAFEVLLDGRFSGRGRKGDAPVEASATAGRHRLTVKADGHKTYEGHVDIPAGQALPVRVRLIPNYPRGTAWVQALVGAALLGGGTYLGLRVDQMHRELERDRRRGVLTTADSRPDDGPWLAMGADAAFLVGGTFAALSTWNFLRDPLPESSLKRSKPVEFNDPLKRTAARPQLGSRSAH
jgi:PEGA domain